MVERDRQYFIDQLRKLRSGDLGGDASAVLEELQSWLEAGKTTEAAVPAESYLPVNLFQEIVGQALVGIGVFKGDEVLYANQHLLSLFGMQGRTPQQMHYLDFFCRYASERTRLVIKEREALMQAGLEKLEPFVGEFQVTPGEKLFLQISSMRYDSPLGLTRICFMLDVTDSVVSRAALDQRMHQLQSIIVGTDAGTWEWDLIEQAGTYNEKWWGIAGYTSADAGHLGRNPWASLVHPEDEKLVDRLFADLFRGATEGVEFEARLRHKMGHWVWVYCRGRVTEWDQNGNPARISGASIDVTDRKIAEEKLVQANQKLEQSVKALSVASKVKEDFLSTMSHEIRTPLNAVIGLTNLLLRRQPRPDQLEIVQVLKNSSDNLLHLVNDILDYSKIQAGKLQLESVAFNFREFLEHLYSTFKLDAQDRGIELQVKADSQIPDILGGDVTRLNQILINLMSNALKFTKKGRVSLDASLVSNEEGWCTIKFVVTDTGIGIHPSNLDKLFEPFQQSDASITRQFGGTGLGLSIIKALVTMFGGSIEVSSLPGKGSSFTVQLQLREQASTPADPWSIGWELPFSTTRMKILYVEDVESNRFLVRNLMEEFHLKCTLACSGMEALELTQDTKFDLILMDIQMPDMDGFETARRIGRQPKGANNNTPIVAFTAEAITNGLKKKLRENNMWDVVTKPFDIKQFLDKISQLAVDVDGKKSYSLEFYDRPSTGIMSSEIRRIVADEMETFSGNLFSAYQKKDMASMRAEIHKLHPIVKNLKMMKVSMLLDRLRDFQSIDFGMFEVLTSIKTEIDPIVEELRAMAGTSK